MWIFNGVANFFWVNIFNWYHHFELIYDQLMQFSQNYINWLWSGAPQHISTRWLYWTICQPSHRQCQHLIASNELTFSHVYSRCPHYKLNMYSDIESWNEILLWSPLSFLLLVVFDTLVWIILFMTLLLILLLFISLVQSFYLQML